MLFIKEKTGKYNFYATLKSLIRDYPHLKWDTVMYYLSRKQKPYITEELEIYKGVVKKEKRKITKKNKS